MSRFSIQFLPNAEEAAGSATRIGEIHIGEFKERFESSIEFWTAARYESQWAEALSRLGPEKAKSCLITSITDPATANFVFWWPMYLVGDNVHFQNHVLFTSEVRGTFDPNDPYFHVPERRVTNEDGERISEWVVPFGDVARAKSSLLGISVPVSTTDNAVRS